MNEGAVDGEENQTAWKRRVASCGIAACEGCRWSARRRGLAGHRRLYGKGRPAARRPSDGESELLRELESGRERNRPDGRLDLIERSEDALIPSQSATVSVWTLPRGSPSPILQTPMLTALANQSRLPAFAACIAWTLVPASLAQEGTKPAEDAISTAPQVEPERPAVPGGWNDERLNLEVQGFLDREFSRHLQTMARLVQAGDDSYPAIRNRIHGDHREFTLQIERLIQELSSPRWATRERAERTLIEVGARGGELIRQHATEGKNLEERIRCERVLKGIQDRGMDDEEREIARMRGLTRTALYFADRPRIDQALRSALGHADSVVLRNTLIALGITGNEQATGIVGTWAMDPANSQRATAISTLAKLQGEDAADKVKALLRDDGGLMTHQIAWLARSLQDRGDDTAMALLATLEQSKDPVRRGLAALRFTAGDNTPRQAVFTLPDRSTVEADFLGMDGAAFRSSSPVDGLPFLILPFAESVLAEFPDQEAAPAIAGHRLFLTQGSLLTGTLVSIDPESIRFDSARFGELTVSRSRVQGLAFDPKLDRLVGASTQYDRVRGLDGEFIKGAIGSMTNNSVAIETEDGPETLALANLAGLMFRRPQVPTTDLELYTRIDLTTGERLLAFVGGANAEEILAIVPDAPARAIPLSDVRSIEIDVGGGALWGFTLIADYAENRIVEIDEKGREVFEMAPVYGAWDVECLDNGNLLITEFSVSQVREVTRDGEDVWIFDDLKNPYEADRLPNGNTLIVDTFGGRVIEVNPAKEIVWSYSDDIRPIDVERLANGNTLITENLKERVFEVDQQGNTVWEVAQLINANDADRLPNGNTLVTLRTLNKVVELNSEGKVVFEIDKLETPTDADRLPNGNTLIAEHGMVREFDRQGVEVARSNITWAVEVNRY